MNRGLARRTVFETDRDARFFLSRIARVVRSGSLEVHAYCLLTTHYHLLVRSSEGSLSAAMRDVQNAYVRWFNRGRQRDGALFRGRFRSKVVDSLDYREQLVRYIDFNAVSAGVVSSPSLHVYGSARWFVQARRPPWLSSEWIDATVRDVAHTKRSSLELYGSCFGRPLDARTVGVIERRLESQAHAADPLDDLLATAPERVLEWMRRKARLADGTEIGLPVCDATDVRELVSTARTWRPSWDVAFSRKSVDAWKLIEIALVRDFCAATWREVGTRVGSTDVGAAQSYRRHAQLLLEDDEYATTVARIAGQALEACQGRRRE